jgi:hypothetical protein
MWVRGAPFHPPPKMVIVAMLIGYLGTGPESCAQRLLG